MSPSLIQLVAFCTLFVTLAAPVAADDITAPLPYQVLQREKFVPQESHPHAVGGAKRGEANVKITGVLASPLDGHIECRTVLMDDAFGAAVDWRDIDAQVDDDLNFAGSITLPAGGWYRLEARRVKNDDTAEDLGTIEPIGVGEVFVITGQSYACGANDELLKVNESQGRVTLFDTVEKTWRVAHDPQPLVGDGGTIWPPLGDLLVPVLQVPVGFVNVAEGGTASSQWLPGERLHTRLLEAGKMIGQFRAVLWQQGESDVIARMSTEAYAKNIRTLRESLAEGWNASPTWLLAKSTLHPTVYNWPEEEARIRAAIDLLWQEPGFARGPDTDILDGANRGPVGTRQHFSGLGQRQAALLWFAAIWQELQFPAQWGE